MTDYEPRETQPIIILHDILKIALGHTWQYQINYIIIQLNKMGR